MYLVNCLQIAYNAKGIDAAVAGWKRLCAHQDVPTFEYNLQTVYNIKGDPVEAVAGWKELLERRPSDRTLQSFLATAYQQMGNVDEAVSG
jgi:predicted Zn-dependent protease